MGEGGVSQLNFVTEYCIFVLFFPSEFYIFIVLNEHMFTYIYNTVTYVCSVIVFQIMLV